MNVKILVTAVGLVSFQNFVKMATPVHVDQKTTDISCPAFMVLPAC